MSSPVGDSNSWNVLMQLASKVNGGKELTSDELKKLLENADANGDGIIEFSEFKDAFMSAEEYAQLEEDFLEAFESIADMDGDKVSISETDITSAIEEYDASNTQEETSGGSGDYSYSGNYNGGNSGNDTPDLSTKDLPELRTERSDVLSELSAKRAEKEQALSEANIDVSSKQNAYDEATANFAELVKANAEADETLSQFVTEIGVLDGQKNALQGEITSQEGVVNEANTLVSSLSSSLSSLVAPPETIEYFNEETQETQTQKNPAYDAYLQQKEALENELAAAEADLATQEEELESLKDDLQATEEYLEATMLSYMAAKEEAGTLTQEEIEAMDAVDAAKAEYATARDGIAQIEAQYDSDIDSLQTQLIAYNDAITEKELTLPEGYSSENGELTNGENNLLYLEDGQLPQGYKVVDGKIVDEDDNTVGLVTGDEENQQLYLIQEIEPEPLGYANAYYTAAYLFENTVNGDEESGNAIWDSAKFSEFGPSDIALIQEIYDGMVSDYNQNPENVDSPASSFIETAEKELTDNEETKIVFDVIVDALDKADNKIEVEPNNFARYLETNGVDLATATPEQLSALLDKFIVDKYGFDYNEEYYPSVSDEQISKYIGDGGLQSLAEADEDTVQSKIDTILSDETLTPYQQMQLVNIIKSYSEDTTTYVQNYFGENDEFFYATLDEMTKEDSEYSSADMLEFIRQYKNIDSSSSVLGNGENIDTILAVYNQAETNEELSELNTYLNAGAVLNLVQQNYEGSQLEEYTQLLFNATVANSLTDDGKLSVNPEDYGLTEEDVENLQTTYLNADGSTSDKVEKVMADLNAGTIDKSTAQYLVSTIFGGEPNNISDISSVGNENTVGQIFKLFGTKPYQAFDGKLAEPEYIVDGDLHYMLMGPENVDPNQPLPLIIYLGGSGEYKAGEYGTVGSYDRNGNGTIEDGEVKYNAPGTVLSGWDLQDFNGYVIAPSMDGVAAGDWDNATAEEYVRQIVASFKETHNVNTDMIFVGGHSLGGTGALYMAEHADDIFSKAFVFSGYSDYSYNINNISIPIIGYNGVSDSGFMSNTFQYVFGDENMVKVNTAHGAVPVNAFQRDADGDGKSDLFEWLLEDQELPENSDEY